MKRGTHQASLRLRTDVGLLASLYPRRVMRAGAPFSLHLSFSLFYLFSSLPFHLSIFSLCLSISYMYTLSLSISNVPPSSSPPPSSTLTFQLRVPALPRSHSARFSSPPTVHRFNHEYISFHLAAFESSFSLRSIPPLIFYLSFPASPASRPAPFLSHFRLPSLSCSILRRSSIFPPPTFCPTRSAFLFLWLSVYLG